MNAFSKLLNQHVSIRNFKPEPIAQSIIDEVCADAIAGGSSSGNLNSVSVVLTRDAARKEKLFDFHFRQPMVLQAPLVMTFCGDWFRTREWLRARGARDNFNNFLGYHVAAFDAIIFAQNVCLGFEARGIGICYMGTTLHSMRAIADFLELPETCVPVTSIVVGYPNEAPPKRDRLPAQALVHDERYSVPNAETLDAIYAEREVRGWERYMSMPGLKTVIEENGITSLAQFYTSRVKYDPDTFARDSQELMNTLQHRGFMK
jgi:nitroreductase